MVQHSPGPTVQAGHHLMTSAEEALHELRNRILSGSMAAGTKLHQEQLASSLGMSRIPIRDAIRTLVAEGLVLQFPRRTAVVAPISADDLTELYEIPPRHRTRGLGPRCSPRPPRRPDVYEGPPSGHGHYF